MTQRSPQDDTVTLTMMSRAGRHLCDWAEGRGAPRERVRDALGVEESTLQDPEGRILARRFLDALGPATAGVETARPGLKLPQGWGVELFDVLGYLIYTSPTLRVALSRVIEFKDLWSQAEEVWFEERADAVHVFWELRLATHPMAEIMTDMAYADLVGGTQAMFEARAPLREVRIPGIAPQSLGAHQEISAGATLTFGAPRLEVIYDLGFLDWEMPHADELLHGYFEERARELRERLPQGTRDVTHRVRELVRARLIGGPPELDEIAGVLGASVRTVQRWLSGEGGSYGKVVEETRRELACVHLRAGKLSVAEISWMLGFSEPRAFHRAFKRWMTQTPGAYRKANLQKKTSEPDVQA